MIIISFYTLHVLAFRGHHHIYKMTNTFRKYNCNSNFRWGWKNKILFFTVEIKFTKVKVPIFLIRALLRHLERLYCKCVEEGYF